MPSPLFGSSKRFFNRPASFNSAVERANRNLEMFAQLDNAAGNALNGVNLISAAIAILFVLITPFAIGFLVIAVIVNAINGHTLGAFSHIFQKVWERIKPAFTNRYAASTVVVIGLMVWISYASLHVLPTAVSARVYRTMSCKSGSCGILFIAPTRFDSIRQQACLLNISLVAALTKASPIPHSPTSKLSWCGFGNYFKSCECSSCEGYFLRHDVGAINVVFNGGCSADTDARHVYYANPRYV